MFHRRYFDLAPMQGGIHRGVADIFRMRANVDRVIQIGAPKYNAGVRQRGAQSHENFLARMQPDAGGANRILQGSLIQH